MQASPTMLHYFGTGEIYDFDFKYVRPEGCIPRSGKCDLNSKAARFRAGEEVSALFNGQVEQWEDGLVCEKRSSEFQRYKCQRPGKPPQ